MRDRLEEPEDSSPDEETEDRDEDGFSWLRRGGGTIDRASSSRATRPLGAPGNKAAHPVDSATEPGRSPEPVDEEDDRETEEEGDLAGEILVVSASRCLRHPEKSTSS